MNTSARLFAVIILMLAGWFSAMAEEPGDRGLDSLKRRADLERNPSARVDLLYAIAVKYVETDSLQFDTYISKAYRQAQDILDTARMGKCMMLRAHRSYTLGRFVPVEETSRRAMSLLMGRKDTVSLLYSAALLLNSLEYQKKDIEAEPGLLEFLEATMYLDHHPNLKMQMIRALIYGCLSGHYVRYDTALSRKYYILQYGCLKRSNSVRGLISYHIDYANFNVYVKNIPEAIRNAKLALEITEKDLVEYETEHIMIAVSLGQMLIMDGKIQEAERYFTRMVEVSTNMRQRLNEARQKDIQIAVAKARAEESRLRMMYVAAMFLLALLLISLGFHWYYRSRELKKDVAFKLKVAMDLHDEVGTLISKTYILSQKLRQEIPDHEGRIAPISENCKNIIASFRDALWSADNRTDEFANLVDRVIDIGHKATEDTRFTFLFQKQASFDTIRMSVFQKRNVMMIIRECIHNALKHSNGDVISIRLFTVGKRPAFSISDNGIPEKAPESGQGMGLRNMQLRAARIHADIRFETDDKGFHVTLVL